MNRLKIITIPNQILRQKSEKVSSFDDWLLNFCEDLKNLLEQQKNPTGLGLSAPQVGIPKRIFVGKIGKIIKPYINPKITKFSKEKTEIIEGCLSVPLYYGHVSRPAEINLEFQNQKGKKLHRHYKGISSRVIQHEVDHLNGILFIDHVHQQGGKLYKVIGRDKKGKEKLAEVKLV